MYLSSSDYSMEKIAELCGFPSANYFGLIFKKHYGISPLNYRKKR
jgi:transcriptional regulator GlxA family with amidase domain